MRQDIIERIANSNIIELEFMAKHIIKRQKQLIERRKHNLEILKSQRK